MKKKFKISILIIICFFLIIFIGFPMLNFYQVKKIQNQFDFINEKYMDISRKNY